MAGSQGENLSIPLSARSQGARSIHGDPALEYALMAQNIVITLINVFGIYRWLIWKGKV
jgi:hypothetical protein